jgi:hypothetical protein
MQNLETRRQIRSYSSSAYLCGTELFEAPRILNDIAVTSRLQPSIPDGFLEAAAGNSVAYDVDAVCIVPV